MPPILPFSLTDFSGVEQALLVALVAFIFMRACTREIQVNELDLFVMTNVTMAFSIAIVFSYWRAGEMVWSDVALILELMGAFYLTVFTTAKFLRINRLKPVAREAAIEVMTRDPLRNAVILISFAIGFPTLLIISLSSLNAGFNSQYSILHESGPFRLLIEGGIPIFFFFAFASNIISGKFLNTFMIAAVIIIGPLGGSKSAALSYVLMYFTVSGIFRQEISIRRLVKLSPLLILALPTMLIPFLLQGINLQTGITASLVRFFLSGDLYYYTFVAARPDFFYNFYDWTTYLLHPFLALIGQRAYDLPLGAVLFSHFLGTETVSGPNPHATVLGLVLFNGNMFGAFGFCVFLGILTTIMRYWSFKIFLFSHLPPVIRSLISVTLAFNAPFLFLDFGSAERYVLGCFLISVSILTVGLITEMVKSDLLNRQFSHS